MAIFQNFQEDGIIEKEKKHKYKKRLLPVTGKVTSQDNDMFRKVDHFTEPPACTTPTATTLPTWISYYENLTKWFMCFISYKFTSKDFKLYKQ